MTPEEISKKFMGQLTVYAPSKTDPIDEQHWQDAETWLTQAIQEHHKQLTEALITAVEALKEMQFSERVGYYDCGDCQANGPLARTVLNQIDPIYKLLEKK